MAEDGKDTANVSRIINMSGEKVKVSSDSGPRSSKGSGGSEALS